jgi:DNA-binding transcriptional ArsR family regulator
MHRTPHPFRELVGPARGRLIEALRAGSTSGVHLRELSRGAGLSLSSLQRELDRLLSSGLLTRRKQANRVVFDLKRGEPLVKLLLAAAAALDLRGVPLEGMPADRQAEKAFVGLCAHFPPDVGLWKDLGDAEFLAGVAVMLAGHSGFDRAAYLALAESLSPGSSTRERHEAWHRAHRPDLPRLFSMVDRERRTHARAEDQ